MTPETMQQLDIMIGKYFMMFVGFGLIAMMKDFIRDFISAYRIFAGNDINADDILYLGSDEKESRVARVKLWKTIFYMKDDTGDWNIKMPVENKQLSKMVIKKKMPKNGGNSTKII